MKPFEAPQRRVKIKAHVNFLSSPVFGMERVKLEGKPRFSLLI